MVALLAIQASGYIGFGIAAAGEEVADLLVIVESTAKTHVKRILMKISARDRAQAVVLAYRAGLMTPGGR